MSVADAPFSGFYQVAYVTRDIAAAEAEFGASHGIGHFMQLRDIRYATGPGRMAHCHVSLAYSGATEIELIQPIDGDVGLYLEGLPDEAGPVARFHHLCRRFATRDAFDAEVDRLLTAGVTLPIRGEMEGIGSYFYSDTRARLGHFVEGIWFETGAADWLASIPRF